MVTADFDLSMELGQISRKAASMPLAVDSRQTANELEDVVALFNFQLSRIDNTCERWSEAIANNATQFSWDDFRKLSNLYEDWLGAVESIAPQLQTWVSRFGELQGAQTFLDSLRRVKLMSLDTEGSKRSIDSSQQGRSIALDYAMKQLRNSLPTQMLPPVTSSVATSAGSGFHTRIVLGVAVAGAGMIGGAFYGLLWAFDAARLW